MSIADGKSSLSIDIADISDTDNIDYNSLFTTEVKLHTTEKDLDVTDNIGIVGLTIFRDYINNISDYIEIDILCPLGNYMFDIYPYLENIEVTVMLTRQLTPDSGVITNLERYKAIYLLERNSGLPTEVTADREVMNKQPPIVLSLQLIDRAVEPMRIKTVQGSFGVNVNPGNDLSISNFLRGVSSHYMDKVLIDNQPAIDKIEIEEPSNTDILKDIVIPSATRLLELPEFIQTQSSGIYNAGIGNYIQRFSTDNESIDKVYFIYSVYNSGKYNKSNYKLMFYAPANSKDSLRDKTYSYEDGVLRVMTESIGSLDSSKESLLMSTGIGFSTAAASAYMRKPVEMEEDGPVFKSQGLNTEVILLDRADGLNYAPGRGVSYNNFKIASEIASRIGSYVTLSAYNVDPDFIMPGAPCKIMYEDKYDDVVEIYGVLHKVKIVYQLASSDLRKTMTETINPLVSKTEFIIYLTEDL